VLAGGGEEGGGGAFAELEERACAIERDADARVIGTVGKPMISAGTSRSRTLRWRMAKVRPAMPGPTTRKPHVMGAAEGSRNGPAKRSKTVTPFAHGRQAARTGEEVSLCNSQ
jgi:hypothetical protein